MDRTHQPIIGLCGYKGSGKDTAAGALVALGWQQLAFATPLREFCLDIDPVVTHPDMSHARRLSEVIAEHGWQGVKATGWSDSQRRVLIDTSRAVRRLHDPVWVEQALARIDPAAPGVVLTDVRFTIEVDALHELGAHIVEVRRAGVVSDGSPSETIDFHVDAVVPNDTTVADLHHSVLRTAELLGALG